MASYTKGDEEATLLAAEARRQAKRRQLGLEGAEAADVEADCSVAAEVLREVQREDETTPRSYADTLLPDGTSVDVQLDHIEVVKFFNRIKWCGLFWIVEEGPWHGWPILRVWSAPRPGRRLAAQHNLRLDYIAITGLRPPPIPKKKPERFLELFLRGVILRARTRVVDRCMDPNAQRWAARPEQAWYSVIDGFGGNGAAAVVAGTPFVLRGRRKKEE